MKRFLTALVTVLLLTAALSVTASASDFDAAAEDLSTIGMFRGTASGFELDRAPKRSEAAIMLVRLYGAEESAKAAYEAGEITHPFTDVSAFTSPYVAWLYTKGITNGKTATTFGSAEACSAKMYSAFLLRALGYKDGVDFQYADTLTFAQSKGIFDTSLFTGEFLRDDLAALTYQGLATDLADGSTYLLDSLVTSGAIDAKAAAPMTEKIENYRALLSSTAETMGTSLDTDFDLDMYVLYSVEGTDNGTPFTETQGMDMTASGNIKMILDDDIQMALEMELSTMGETMESAMWIKDGWIYIPAGDELGKYPLDDQLVDYQELLNQSMGQMNVSMLPMIDSITAKKSGSDTIYTMTLNDAFSGLMDDTMALVGGVTDETAGVGMDMAVNDMQCVYTYVVSSKGQLKSCSADMALTMEMNMDAGEEGSAVMTMVMDMVMDMDVNATGKNVKIDWPDLSGALEIVGGNSWPAA